MTTTERGIRLVVVVRGNINIRYNVLGIITHFNEKSDSKIQRQAVEVCVFTRGKIFSFLMYSTVTVYERYSEYVHKGHRE